MANSEESFCLDVGNRDGSYTPLCSAQLPAYSESSMLNRREAQRGVIEKTRASSKRRARLVVVEQGSREVAEQLRMTVRISC
jgi:hypothetical protein